MAEQVCKAIIDGKLCGHRERHWIHWTGIATGHSHKFEPAEPSTPAAEPPLCPKCNIPMRLLTTFASMWRCQKCERGNQPQPQNCENPNCDGLIHNNGENPVICPEAPGVGAEPHTNLSDRHLLHRLWTKAVGTPDYVKDEWRRMESIVVRAEAAQHKLAAIMTDVFEVYECDTCVHFANAENEGQKCRCGGTCVKRVYSKASEHMLVAQSNKIAELKAKLAAALPSEEAIARVIASNFAGEHGFNWPICAARAVLAMLKGESHEGK